MKILKTRNMMMLAFTLFLSSVGNFTIGQTVPTQPELKENFQKQELQSFIKANQRIIAIQKNSEAEMIKVIEQKGLTVDKFNELAQAQQSPDKKANVDSKEQQSFVNAANKIMGMQKDINGKMEESIKKEGIDIQTYQQIMFAYQKSPKVKQEIEALLPDQPKP